MKTIYFDVAHAVREHDWIIDNSGGLAGSRDLPQLESVLAHIQNDTYYPDFESKLTHLVFGVVQFHPFLDGNKRSALGLGAYLLEINGYAYCIRRFIAGMENIIVWVAEGKINKDLLRAIITSLLSGADYSESLKLKIIEALGNLPESPFLGQA